MGNRDGTRNGWPTDGWGKRWMVQVYMQPERDERAGAVEHGQVAVGKKNGCPASTRTRRLVR